MTMTTSDNNNPDRNLKTVPKLTSTYDDDVTEPTGSNRSRNGEAQREFNVKWQMKGGSDVPSIKKKLHHLFTTLLIEFPNQVILIDRKQREWTFQESEDEASFLKEFEKSSIQLHPIKTSNRR